MPEDRKLKLVLKGHDCLRVGEVTPYESFDAVSRVNDVGEATLVASYSEYERSNEVLDALDTPDVIIEAYIQPPGHDTFMDEPAWAGFLRDRRVTQDGPTWKVTAVFKDYNHLLTRRVVKPPPGASHDEGYGCTPDVMRDLVRRHCAELADAERQFPGLSVEPNECLEEGGLYGTDASLLVLGNNHLEWVRCNALISWNGHLYAGLEPQESSGTYGEIWRSADGDGWEQVYSGDPTLLYGDDVTGIHSFCEFDGKLFAGASTDYLDDGDGIVLMSTDGQAWGVVEVFTGCTAVWALAEFEGELYAGTKGGAMGVIVHYTTDGDGLVWDTAMVGGEQYNCYSLLAWGDYLYAGVSEATGVFGLGDRCGRGNYRAKIRRSDDGVTWNTVWERARTFGVLCFLVGSDGNLYAGTGTHRFDWFQSGGLKCPEHLVDQYARVLVSPDGAAWTLTGPADADDAHPRTGIVDGTASGVTCLLEVTLDDGSTRLVACLGGVPEGTGTLWASADWGGEWYQAFVPYIGYRYSLAIATHAGSEYAAFGSVERDHWGPFPWIDFQPDHGDVWRVVIPADDIPESGTVARWVILLDKLRELAEQSGVHDFAIVGLDGNNLYCDPWQSFQFRVRNPQWGTDSRWDGTSGVSFSIQRNNMALPEYAEIRSARPTYLYLLGAAAAEERTVLEFPNTAEMDDSPWNRVEGVADAQGVDSPQAMLSLGWSELWLQGPQKTFDFTALETESLHWRGGSDDPEEGWGLGDIVTATFAGALANCKIMEVALSAREGSPVYVVSPTFEALSVEVAGAVEQYMLCGGGFPHVGNLGGIWRSTPDVAWYLQATLAGGYEEPRALLRTSGGVVLAGTRWEGSVWYSEDEGLSWAKAQDITGEKEVMCMMEVTATGTLLLGTARDAEVWRSTDGGYTWTLAQKLEAIATDNYVYSIVEAADGNLLAGGIYPNIARDAEVWRSTDDGVTWTLADTLVGANYVTKILLAENGYLAAACNGGVGAGEFWRSTDNGLNWTYVCDITGQTMALAMLLLPDGSMLAGTYDWGGTAEIWRSADNGASWTKICEPAPGYLDVCYALELDHENAVVGAFKRTVWANDAEIWRSIDGGYSWVQQAVLTGYQYGASLLRVGEPSG